MQQVSKVTSKFQATIPLAVRRKLGLKPGDAVVFEIENDVVTVRRATAIDREYKRSKKGRESYSDTNCESRVMSARK